MSSKRTYLGVDLGASSGRVLAGRFDGAKLSLEEVHRFENGGVRAGDTLYWDVLGLWNHVVDGLRAASGKLGGEIASVGVDTWGVDFGLLGSDDRLLGNPVHYRDARSNGMLEAALSVVSREEIFAETGLQFMEINTLYQLVGMRRQGSPLLDMADSFLMMGDLFHWLLTGEKVNELTNATTTQFFNPSTGDWSRSLLEKLQLPTRMLRPIVQPGANLGRLRASLAEAANLHDVDVIVPGTHDTASAVMAVPAEGETSACPDWCYISSGTWSLMGVEVSSPVINDKCRGFNFTNEGGVGGSTRLLKNIAGLWLVQECRRIWKEQGRDYSWSELVRLAQQAPPLESLIEPDHPQFVAPADMPGAIREYCRATGQPVPGSEGAVIRTALESLALRYRMVLSWLEELIGGRIETIHIVGGGTQNRELCQMTADATGRRVVAGPVEATAIGNVMMQAVARGDVGGIREAREVIKHSFDVEEYRPRHTHAWDDAYARFEKLLAA
ncbi:MAG: rhamnulokinase, partial [Planctomycetales bacterium]|nr:rhamnulokinase [Planctomycetales bacterium]